MNILPVNLLLMLLILLVLLSAFFSGSETGMMSVNRYRLRHLARKKNRSAQRVLNLLGRTDRLLGVILLGNTFANILASAIATFIAVHYFGEMGVVISTIALTVVILIFAEISPKLLAATYPEKVAFSASLPLVWLLRLLYPLVWILNGISNGFLRLFRVKISHLTADALTGEELRTVVYESRGKIASGRKDMLLGVLDLEKITVDDIMVPRNEIIGIDLDESWDTILTLLKQSQHTRLPIYRGSIDQAQGILHLREALNLMAQTRLNKETLLQAASDVYYVPEGTLLHVQLANFRQKKLRIGMVVDEYGDIQGMVTLEDLLEEIVGEFTTGIAAAEKAVDRQKDGSFCVDGGINVRDLNRTTGWMLPTNGPKTLSGLIIEHLETIPGGCLGLRLAGYPIEIIELEENTVKRARIWPDLRRVPKGEEEHD